MSKLILLEVNEVPFTIWDRYIAAHPSSAIAALFERSHQLQTVTEDSGFRSNRDVDGQHVDHSQLTPWTTWPTVHRGVTNDHHGVLDIGQDLASVNEEYPSVWEILARDGVSVGVFGSLHSYPIPEGEYSFYVPDPFAASDEVIPSGVQSFQTFNLEATRHSGRNVGGLDLPMAVRFLLDSPRLGLKLSTVAALVRQLAYERIRPAMTTRRRSFQTTIGFDIFHKLLRNEQPAFATFFANHVAASMHRYWAAAYPEDYSESPADADWSATFESEIDFAMSVIDTVVGRLTRFCDAHPEYRLVVASSMGQEPTKAKRVTRELAVVDQQAFMGGMGVPVGAWDQSLAMFPNFNFTVDEAYQSAFRDSVSTLRVNDQPLDYREADHGFFSLDFGHPNLEDLAIELDGESVDGALIGLENMPINDLALKCADHVPHGSLVIYVPSGVDLDQDRRSVTTTQLAPAIIKELGCELPAYMDQPQVPGFVGVPLHVS